MKNKINNKKGNIIYISHGGGPLPLLGDPTHDKMIEFMKEFPKQIEKPDEILVISGHWEEAIPTIITNDSPPLYYDYYGFPDESYNVQYPAPGNPKLAKEVINLLLDKGIQSETNIDRGFDHGVFVPLKLMYPNADIPITQLSLINGLNPKEHIELGHVLTKLTEHNILIIGSGTSFHNMGAFEWGNIGSPDPENDMFQDWLIDVCCGSYGSDERKEKLINWNNAPNARYCHPREEHLIPLHVCFGFTQGQAKVIFDDYILGKRSVAFMW